MRRLITYLIVFAFVAMCFSCKKPFNPQLTTVATNFLAVDGAIISGDSTFITLSRTTSLSDANQFKAELKAIVSIEDDQKKQYALTESGKGQYFLPVTNFDPARKYRLDIKTINGKIYQSDFVAMKVTPPIDTIYYTVDAKRVQFFLDAHDATNSTRYYRWDYKEVWEYVSFVRAVYGYANGQVISLTDDPTYPANSAYYCYRHDFSNQIFTGNSANLSQDVIKKQLLSSLPDTSQKVAFIYAMVVRQYALTQDGYKYYQQLKANSEQIGSIFDAQASYVSGNIHCITTPSENVVGFVSASSVTTKTVIFRYTDLGVFKVGPPFTTSAVYNLDYDLFFPQPGIDSIHCTGGILALDPAATFNARAAKTLAKGDTLLIGPYYSQTPFLHFAGYTYAVKQCVDCSYLGDTAHLVSAALLI